MNVPYVKQQDENGKCINPIKGKYVNEHPNRKERREPMQKFRFAGNGNNYPLTVHKTTKFVRTLQHIHLKDKSGNYTGEIKRIEHYLN